MCVCSHGVRACGKCLINKGVLSAKKCVYNKGVLYVCVCVCVLHVCLHLLSASLLGW